MDGLNCVLANENDVVFISETYDENIAALHGVSRSIETWKDMLLNGESIYYIVRAKTNVAWFRIDVSIDELWLGMLQVRPIYQRQGVGKYILSVFENVAKEKSFKKVGIHTTEDNLAARALYQSAGYVLTEIGPCTTGDGKERIGCTFEKEV